MVEEFYLKNDFIKKVYITEFGEFKKIRLGIVFKKIYTKMKSHIEKQNNQTAKDELEKILLDFFPTTDFTKKVKDSTRRKILNFDKINQPLDENQAQFIVESYNGNYYYDTQDKKPEKLVFDNPANTINIIENQPSKNLDRKIFISNSREMELELFRIIINTSKELYFFLSHPEMKKLSDYVLSIVGSKHKKQNLNVNIILYDTNPPNIFASYQKLRVFKHLGCNIASLNYTLNKKPPFIGVIADPEDYDYCKLLSIDNIYNNYLLLDSNEKFLITPLFTSLQKEFTPRIEKYKSPYIPEIISKTKSEYIELLREVKSYKNLDKTKFKIIDFPVSKIGEFFCHEKSGIKEYKIKQHEFFNDFLSSKETDATFTFKYYKNKYNHVINLPIVELVSEKYYIADGHTRLYLAHQGFINNRDFNSTIRIVIIKMVDHECRVEHLQLKGLDKISSNEQNLEGKPNFARNIEKETHTLKRYNWSVDFPFDKKIAWANSI